MRKLKISLIIEFCFILLFFPALGMFLPDKEFSDMENRELVQRPVFSGKFFLDGSYQSDYEEWLNDQFPWRDGWSLAATNLQAAFGKKDINGVYLGKDENLLEKYQETDFEQAQVEDNLKYLSDFLNYAVKCYGKEYVHCMMLPSKTEALVEKAAGFCRIFQCENGASGIGR